MTFIIVSLTMLILILLDYMGSLFLIKGIIYLGIPVFRMNLEGNYGRFEILNHTLKKDNGKFKFVDRDTCIFTPKYVPHDYSKLFNTNGSLSLFPVKCSAEFKSNRVEIKGRFPFFMMVTIPIIFYFFFSQKPPLFDSCIFLIVIIFVIVLNILFEKRRFNKMVGEFKGIIDYRGYLTRQIP